ncbi:MAG: HDOD domain-containing protein [Deltaproteobacteria bacterium]|jgi:HD-like signal output (HDOD) protein|nr:HDOD domain-containing protein [Deltaproteobacteria bacterium]
MSKIQEAREFLSDIEAFPPKLPHDPTLLPKLFASLSDKSFMSMQGLAALVERSQSLAARVLTVANSAMYGLQGGVTSLTRAVQVLGLVELRALVILFSAKGSIPDSKLPRAFPSRDLWEHQVRTAMLARQMTLIIEGTGKKGEVALEADSIHTAALLHDLGKVILAARRPAVWAEISEIARERGCGFAEAEEVYWGMDHGSAAAAMLNAWGLPDMLTQMISWHHHPELTPNYKLETHILAAANHLADNNRSLLTDAPGEAAPRLPERVRQLLPDYAVALESQADSLKHIVLDAKAEALATLMTGLAKKTERYLLCRTRNIPPSS